MNSSLRSFTLLAACGALTLLVRGAEREALAVKFSDPARPGTFRAELPWADLKIRGTDAAEVRILSTMQSKEKSAQRADGLRRLDDTVSFAAVEKDNVISLQMGGGSPGSAHDAQLEVQVPRNTALVLRTEAGGDILVEDVAGDIDISSMNGEVTLKGVVGSTVVNTMNGEINADYKTPPQKTVSLSSMNGEISLRLPADTKANVRLRTHNGAIYTDFDEAVMKTKTEGRAGSLDSQTARAVSEATREAVRAAAEATRAAMEVTREVVREVQREVQRSVAETRTEASTGVAPEAPEPPQAPKAPRAPRAPRPPVIPSHNLIGGKTVTGTLNGGGIDVQVSSMNGTITVRHAK